ncbi:MAG: DUF362 domain-containing protein [candidate division Zixibacteria bacterium]|nr:DUF362 domain-containing protein [candidate division Zixibacteria bacterium]
MMKRRDFIRQTGKAAALAALTAGTGWFFYNRKDETYEVPILKDIDFEISPDSGFPGLTLARDEDHIRALHKALDAIGSIKRFIKTGEKVTIKPNIGWDRAPEQAATTNPVLVGEMVRLCLEAGAGEVIVSDVPCNDARRTFIRSGIKEAAEKAGAKVFLPVDDDFIQVDLKGKILTRWPVLRHFIQTDKFINMPIVKQHSLCTCTIGMKNLYGILGGARNRLHQQIDESIVDLAAFCRPTLVVVDATRVLMRGGPTGGSLSDVEIHNTVLCATDQVAADARSSEFLNARAERISHLTLAEKSGLGKIDYNFIGYKEVS